MAILLPPDDLSGPGLPTHGGRGASIFGDIISDGHGRGFMVKASHIVSYVARSLSCCSSRVRCAYIAPTNKPVWPVTDR